ncbi:MAG: hypothetical protein LIO53_01605 [Oscillospiraceae bacterium]|nr:hypothetical protein [Oscillospiraceae bacterium]
MVGSIYKRTLNIMAKLPFKIWGLSLLSGLLSILILIFGVLPIVTIPVIAALNAGMYSVYLAGYNEQEVSSNQLLSGFKDFKHVAGGMCWRKLWIVLWCLIPIAGPFIAVYKSMAYAFTPYILNEEKSVGALDALKKSMRDTKGYKLNLFIAVIVPSIAYFIAEFILALLAMIPYVGVVFGIISSLLALIYGLFAPMFLGLVRAGFYEYARKPVFASKPQIDENSGEPVKCPVCETENAPGTMFCTKCGSKID